MNLTLDHLPEDKQYQLKLAAEIIVEMAEPEILILFGSYARGDWVEELSPDGAHFQYQSDFDLLAITKNDHLARKLLIILNAMLKQDAYWDPQRT